MPIGMCLTSIAPCNTYVLTFICQSGLESLQKKVQNTVDCNKRTVGSKCIMGEVAAATLHNAATGDNWMKDYVMVAAATRCKHHHSAPHSYLTASCETMP